MNQTKSESLYYWSAEHVSIGHEVVWELYFAKRGVAYLIGDCLTCRLSTLHILKGNEIFTQWIAEHYGHGHVWVMEVHKESFSLNIKCNCGQSYEVRIID